jgi:hypothetical protein
MSAMIWLITAPMSTYGETVAPVHVVTSYTVSAMSALPGRSVGVLYGAGQRRPTMEWYGGWVGGGAAACAVAACAGFCRAGFTNAAEARAAVRPVSTPRREICGFLGVMSAPGTKGLGVFVDGTRT